MPFRVISADSHVIEPHDLWQRYADQRFRDRVPRLVRGETCDRLVGEDYQNNVGLLAGCMRKDVEARVEGRWDEDVFPGGYDPEQRMKDLETDGVDGEVLFPTVALGFYPIADVELQWALFRAYNTWLAEFCGSHPRQLKGIGMLTHETVGPAVEELRRCRQLGHVGVMVPLFSGEALTYRDPALEPLWATAAELGMPMHLHSSTFRDESKGFFAGRTFTQRMLNTPLQIQHVLMDLIFAGVFDRHPGLTVVSTENDAGWAGNTVERGDYWWKRHRRLVEGDDVVCVNPPSHYFHENIRHTFMRDRTAVLARDVIGLPALMWGNDFPHHISTWPHSADLIDDYRTDLSDAEHHLLFCGNAQALYGF